MRRIPNLTARPSSPGAIKPITVAILLNPVRKWRVMMKDVDISNVRGRWTGYWNRDLPLLSSLMVVMHSSCQSESHVEVEGKKKSDGKEGKNKDLRKKWRLITCSNSAIFPSHHAKFRIRPIFQIPTSCPWQSLSVSILRTPHLVLYCNGGPCSINHFFQKDRPLTQQKTNGIPRFLISSLVTPFYRKQNMVSHDMRDLSILLSADTKPALDKM
jgi:hypothetical protein